MPKTPIEIKGGWLNGHLIRTARKNHTCDFWWGNGSEHPTGKSRRCGNPIKPGDVYAQGEMNDEAGGFGHDRYCTECCLILGDELAAAIEKAMEAELCAGV